MPKLPGRNLAVVHVRRHNHSRLAPVALSQRRRKTKHEELDLPAVGRECVGEAPLTLQCRTTTLLGSEVSHVSIALQTAQILSRGGA